MLNILHILIFWVSVFIAITGGDPVAGAIGAAASETAAEAMDKPGATPVERQKIAQKARIIGDTVAFLAGRDVASADSAGRIAVENNFEDHLVEIDAQRAIAKAVLLEEEAAQYLELLDADEKRTLEAARDPFVQTAALSAVGMGVPLVAKTAGVLGTIATGSIAVDSGTKGLVKEAKDHPIMTTLAVMPFVPGPKGVRLVKSGNGIGVKTLRKGIDVNDTRTFIKSMASAKNPMLQKTERIIQNEPVYKVLKDTGCLKKGQFIRLDAAHSRAPGVDTSALPHGHIEILRRKGEKFVEVGKCIVEDSAFVSK